MLGVAAGYLLPKLLPITLQRERLLAANWTGDKPWLRFYCFLAKDTVQEALVEQNRCLTREELDARNCEDRPSSYYQLVADLYNAEWYNPKTAADPDLHDLFRTQISLPFSEMPGGRMTPEDVKNRFCDCRGKLIQVR